MLAAGAACAILLALQVKGTWMPRLRLFALAAAVLVAASQLTFLALNPYLWRDPLGRTAAMFVQRVQEMRAQEVLFPEASMGEGLQRIWLVIRRVLQDYAALHFPGAFLLNAPLFIIGFAHVVKRAVQAANQQRADPAALSILLVGTAASVPALFTPLDWDRYYLLPVYFSMMLIAVGAWRALSAAHNSWTRARRVSNRRA